MREFFDFDLKKKNTFKISALVKNYIELENKEEAKIFKQGDIILGGGSNCVFLNLKNTPRIIKPVFNKIEIIKEDADFVFLRVEAGRIWQELVEYSCKNNFYGLESLAGIYGTVGAAPVQNIGAYGVEAKDVIISVEVYDNKTKEFYLIENKDCKFAYRYSIFKEKPNLMVLAINIKLKKGYKSKRIKQSLLLMQEILAQRKQKLPNPKEFPNAGSFFKNPIISKKLLDNLMIKYPDIPNYPDKNNPSRIKISAAWLIEKAGFKGKYANNVGISEKHALIMVNLSGDGFDIWSHSELIKKEVFFKFGVCLEPEVVFVGSLL